MLKTYLFGLAVCLASFCLLGFGLENPNSELERQQQRYKRGASVYPVFQGGSHYNVAPLPDPKGFTQYLGGGSYGGYNSGAFDQTPLTSYNTYTASQPLRAPSPPSSGGYGQALPSSGGAHIPYFGYTTPNFANSPAPSRPQPAPYMPQLSASALLHTAQSSAYSQNQLINALTQGSHGTPYKGGLV